MPRLIAVRCLSALPVLLVSLLVSGCTARGAYQDSAPRPAAAAAAEAEAAELRPQIVAAQRPMQCVAFARAVSGLPIRGDAWTWWAAANGQYVRDRIPRPGALLVLERTRRLRHGHLAVVTRVLGPRRILVDHANWLNEGRIHRNTPVVDVSPGNDWSSVRVWHIPGNQLGSTSYPAYGFIHPKPLTTAARTAPAPAPATRGGASPPGDRS